jgi:ketosteroid isomerase-like protein
MSIRRLIRIILALGGLAAAGCAGPRPEVGTAAVAPSTAHAADVAEIRATRVASNAAIGRRDVAAVVASMLPAYSVLPAGAPASLSRDSLSAAIARQFEDSAVLGYVRTPMAIEVSATGPTAAEVGRWVGRRRRQDGVQETAGSYYAAWRRTPEGWRLQAETFVALSCTGSAQCPAPR